MATALERRTLSVHEAIQYIVYNDYEGLRQHIVSGGDFTSYDHRTGWAPIHFASHLGRIDCVRVILAFGGHVDQPTKGRPLIPPGGGNDKDKGPSAGSSSSGSSTTSGSS